MPDPKDPIDPKEATEAKLCAYLEGELSPSERTEIEQHLAANPQHRQLLSDLAKTREWMRSIPTESSPFDLAEAFAAQTERSMLLDDPQSGSRLIIRWPQYLSVAAIVALTLGLGVLVVSMLKAPKMAENKSFSLGPAVPISAPATQSILAEKTADQQQLKQPPVTSVQTPLEVASAANETKRSMAKSIPAEAAPARPAVVATRMKNFDASAIDSVKAKLQDAGYRLPIDQKTICFVVSADAPPASMDQVRGFFNRHQLAYDDAITGKHESSTNGLLALGGGGFGGGQGLSPSTQPIGLANNNATNNNGGGRLQNAQTEQSQGSNENFANGVPPSQFNNIRAGNAFITPTTAPADRAIYVADGLTQLQLELLSASLEGENQNQSVRRLTLSEGIAPPPTSQPIGTVKVGETLTITVAELVAPGVEKTNVVKVADDGTIALPMIDPLPAAGLLPTDLQRRIADKYKEANLIPQATVTVAMAAPPSTQAIVPTTQATTQPAVAATQPIAPPVVNNLTNVVVVIEKSASVLPGK
jgi:Polysaccharide biosynthesis/export protein/Putative zinc-finger